MEQTGRSRRQTICPMNKSIRKELDEIYRYDRDTHRLSVIPGSVQEEQAGMVLS